MVIPKHLERCVRRLAASNFVEMHAQHALLAKQYPDNPDHLDRKRAKDLLDEARKLNDLANPAQAAA